MRPLKTTQQNKRKKMLKHTNDVVLVHFGEQIKANDKNSKAYFSLLYVSSHKTVLYFKVYFIMLLRFVYTKFIAHYAHSKA